jgi:small subunit ribosomal protein S7
MRHKKAKTSRYLRLKPDLKFGNLIVAKFINKVMKAGRKSIAAKQVYSALDILANDSKSDPIEFLKTALENVKPELEVRSRRVGGANYQVPMPVRPERKDSLAIRWLIAAASDRPNKTYHTFAEKLAAEIKEAHENQGGAVKKKLDTHKMAEANKAFAHFRW